MNLPSDTKSSSIVLKTGYDTIIFDPKKDIAVSVDYCFFQSTSALGGGFCIFFVGDTQQQIVSGAPGPGLGYTTVSDYSYKGITSFPGVSGAYVGVAFDVDGWFSLSGTNITGGLNNISPNSICVRGGTSDNYSFIGNSGNLHNYPTAEYPNTQSLSLSCEPNEYKTIRISLTNFSTTLTVEFKNSRGEFVTYYQTNLNLTPPNTNIRAGLSYSTGVSGNNNFWIKGINFRGNQGYTTPTPTQTRTKTQSQTRTNTQTPTTTPNKTQTPTQSRTRTNTPTHTRTRTNSVTPTQTPTQTRTVTNTPTLTRTRTNTPTQTRTRTATQFSTPTRTKTQTPTQTRTNTQTPTQTRKVVPQGPANIPNLPIPPVVVPPTVVPVNPNTPAPPPPQTEVAISQIKNPIIFWEESQGYKYVYDSNHESLVNYYDSLKQLSLVSNNGFQLPSDIPESYIKSLMPNSFARVGNFLAICARPNYLYYCYEDGVTKPYAFFASPQSFYLGLDNQIIPPYPGVNKPYSGNVPAIQPYLYNTQGSYSIYNAGVLGISSLPILSVFKQIDNNQIIIYDAFGRTYIIDYNYFWGAKAPLTWNDFKFNTPQQIRPYRVTVDQFVPSYNLYGNESQTVKNEVIAGNYTRYQPVIPIFGAISKLGNYYYAIVRAGSNSLSNDQDPAKYAKYDDLFDIPGFQTNLGNLYDQYSSNSNIAVYRRPVVSLSPYQDGNANIIPLDTPGNYSPKPNLLDLTTLVGNPNNYFHIAEGTNGGSFWEKVGELPIKYSFYNATFTVGIPYNVTVTTSYTDVTTNNYASFAPTNLQTFNNSWAQPLLMETFDLNINNVSSQWLVVKDRVNNRYYRSKDGAIWTQFTP